MTNKFMQWESNVGIDRGAYTIMNRLHPLAIILVKSEIIPYINQLPAINPREISYQSLTQQFAMGFKMTEQERKEYVSVLGVPSFEALGIGMNFGHCSMYGEAHRDMIICPRYARNVTVAEIQGYINNFVTLCDKVLKKSDTCLIPGLKGSLNQYAKKDRNLEEYKEYLISIRSNFQVLKDTWGADFTTVINLLYIG